MLGTMCAVIIQADDLDVPFLGEPAGVVLEAELGVVRDGKVGALSMKAPDDGAISAVDLVNGASVAG